VGGLLDTFDTFISEEELKERYGGGKYELRVFKIGPKGNWVFGGQRSVEIAGEPFLLPSTATGVQPVSQATIEDNSLQRHALGMTERIATQERERAAKLEDRIHELSNKGGIDMTMISAILDPLKTQVQTLTNVMTEKDRQIHDLFTKKPDKTTSDLLLEKMLLEEQQRAATVRSAHESEMRAVRETMREDAKRAEDRADRLISQNDRQQQRELDALKQAYEGRLENLKVSYEARLESMKHEVTRLDRDLEVAKKEIVELRAKKEKPIQEQLGEIAALKDTFQSLMGDEEESTADKIISALAPLAEGLGNRIGGPQPQEIPPQPQQAALPRPKRGKPGSTPAVQAQAQPQPQISREVLEHALNFIETAIANGTAPETFAASVRHVLPGEVVDFIRAQGIEGFLDGIEQVKPQSNIASINGKQFMRKSWQILETPEEGVS